ncbi:hypothetical protein NDU88_007884 [Pleurodeles waltl]|uniref:Uncharacterized protein n=1 Tax=Pleurodeles waltl TaxID=8319 RepID=A0AAV7VS25_PLEWA|nr:hypothetical protein NDU88_007884 [Pleurodeles waltl]
MEDGEVDESIDESPDEEVEIEQNPVAVPSRMQPLGEHEDQEESRVRGGRYHLRPNPVPNSRLCDFVCILG